MQVVCEATQIKADKRVCVAALQCLVNIMSLYYQYMELYMANALFRITYEAMKSTEDDICLQGIEFWSNVCDEEIELAVEAEEASEQGRPPEHVSKFYAKGALKFILPIVLECLTRQDEHDDEDEWNPAKAAGVCLMLMSQCVGNEVLVQSLDFITLNIVHADWRYRDASVMAFGSVLDGVDGDQLKTLTVQALPTMIGLLKDVQIIVRDSAAWCLGRLCEVCPEVVLVPEVLRILLPALSESLHQEARVATNVCWAISGLAQAAYEQANENSHSDDTQPETYILSSCFEAMVSELLKATDRPDSHMSNLRNAAYEAVMELIKNSPKDCYPIVRNTTVIILKKLEILSRMENNVQSTSDAGQLHDLQSLLCATLQSVLSKVQKEDALQISNEVMSALLQIMTHAARGTTVMEDALMAASALITVLGSDFMPYFEHFKMFLIAGLRNHSEHQVCQAAVGIVADLSRSLGDKILPFTDELLSLLLEILNDSTMDKSVRPQVVAVFGDVALAIGPHFFKYLETILTVLMQAATADVDRTDFDAVDYLNQLRESCLEAYTGILQGFKGDSKELTGELQRIQPYINQIIEFLDRISADANQPDSVLAAAAGLIGDLLTVYGASILKALDRDPIQNLLHKARWSKSAKAKTLGNWASKVLRKLRP
uniref:Importin subunit beta-1/Transportin-1-like TPR repeats domain-containing protein n=1 Tax=Romanomermis culicivorax TaxID=13658 RepID=A0A915L5R3_ROMCU